MKVIVHPHYAALNTEIAQIPAGFALQGEVLHGGRNTVKRFSRPDTNWVVKHYKRPNLIQRIAYTFFKPSKAERAYRYAQILQERGIDTPDGIAYIELKSHGLLSDCYFISPECTDRPIFPELVETPDYDRTLADELATFFVEMHRKGILHGDLNLSNILYRKEADGKLHFTVIDTNRSQFKDSLSRHECLHNLMRVTHRRDLLDYIVRQYAALRGWEATACSAFVQKALEKFERRRALRHRLLRRKQK